MKQIVAFQAPPSLSVVDRNKEFFIHLFPLYQAIVTAALLRRQSVAKSDGKKCGLSSKRTVASSKEQGRAARRRLMLYC
jgi:hypothetical protein